ncbi:MAG: terminase family protein [Methanobacterium paludis]|nr:terminase family protein [Methanobacterium paludis]
MSTEMAVVKAHFPSFAKFVYPNYKFAPHLMEISNAFRDIQRRKTTRLIINMPPRFGKSLTTSTIFPAWYLINNPDHRILFTAYESDFASTFGMKARDIVNQHGKNWNIEVNNKSKARNAWDIDGYLGGMNTAGVGGSLTGRGADVLIIDDPIKNAEESMSENTKAKIMDWFLSTAYTRLEPDGVIIIIQTRWALDDLTGRILDESDEDWKTLVYPAMDTQGNSMWESRFSTQRMHEIKKQVGDYWWNSLYMQDPRLKEGGMFNAEKLVKVSEIPCKIVRKVRAWDIGTIGDVSDNPDFTVGALMHLGENGKVYIRDIKRFRGTPAQVENTMLATAVGDDMDTNILIEQQPGTAGVIVKNLYNRLLSGYPVSWSFPSKSKGERATPMSVEVELGQVSYFKGNWNEDMKSELNAFIPDACPFDDQVDALSMGFNYLKGFEKRSIGDTRKFRLLNL